MKLLNHTSKYLSLLLLPLITIWAVAFYYAMLDEIYDSLDDGLGNQKVLLLKRAAEDPSILEHDDFEKHIYNFTPISETTYINFNERYQDTLMYMYYEDDFEPVRIYESALKQGNGYYKLKIITSMVEEDDLIQDLVTYLVVLYLLLVISIVLLNNLLLKKIWQPFYYSISQLRNFKIEKENSITTLPTKIDEFSLLNETINKLIKKSSESYIEQKQFIENASHELQTPLAISINKLELFLENSPLDDQQAQELVSVLDTLGRLTRLNKSLLLLSKIENKQFPEEEWIDFGNLTTSIIKDFEDLAFHKNIVISANVNAPLKYQMNRDLAIILLNNLVKNALVYGKENESITITIDDRTWMISNLGTAASLDRTTLFSRFKKQNNTKQSTGLGLAIAKAIASKHQLQVKYEFDGRHQFAIHFP